MSRRMFVSSLIMSAVPLDAFAMPFDLPVWCGMFGERQAGLSPQKRWGRLSARTGADEARSLVAELVAHFGRAGEKQPYAIARAAGALCVSPNRAHDLFYGRVTQVEVEELDIIRAARRAFSRRIIAHYEAEIVAERARYGDAA